LQLVVRRPVRTPTTESGAFGEKFRRLLDEACGLDGSPVASISGDAAKRLHDVK
jgi:hypothetical protein